MLSRVWVERAGSESAVFGGARPLSDLVDMPIDTVYMSYGYAVPCYAMLCLCLVTSLPSLSFPPLLLSLSLFVFLSCSLFPRVAISPSSYVISLFLHLAHLFSWLLCPLLFLLLM